MCKFLVVEPENFINITGCDAEIQTTENFMKITGCDAEIQIAENFIKITGCDAEIPTNFSINSRNLIKN